MGVIDNKVVFISNPDFADNSRALYEYLDKKTDFDSFWIVRDKRALRHLRSQSIECALEGSTLAKEAVKKAKYIISTSFDLAYEKRADQIHVSLWHGFGPKVVGFFEGAAASSDAFEDLNIITTQCDFMTVLSPTQQLLSAGKFAVDPRKLLDTGFPRNDYLFSTNGRENLYILFPNISSSKMIMYLPTTRRGLKVEGAQFEDNIFNYKDYDAREVDELLEKHDAYIIGKLHFADFEKFQNGTFDLPKRLLLIDEGSLRDNNLTLYHLLNGFDCVITDYSSVYSDFMLLDRPIVFSCPDIDLYSKDRGFVANDPRFMMPGANVSTQSELLYALESILNGIDEYKPYRDFMFPFFHTHKDGHSSQRVFEAMLKASEKRYPDCHKDFGDLYINPNCSLSQYTGRCKGKLYFDTGAGFNEEQAVSLVYDLNNTDKDGYVRIVVDCPFETGGAIRFDPDCNNRMIFQDFALSVNGDILEYYCPDGVKKDMQIAFLGSSPQFVIDLSGKVFIEHGAKISIRFKPIDLVGKCGAVLAESWSEYSKLKRELQIAKNELDEVYSSNSWKITKPLRMLKKQPEDL